jgi:hypothetical protein
MKYEKIAVSVMEAQSDGKSTNSQSGEAV